MTEPTSPASPSPSSSSSSLPAPVVAFCIPVYDDWESAQLLLSMIDDAVADQGWQCHVLLIDDGSRSPQPSSMASHVKGLQVTVLKLRRNLGHQRAIAIGLAYVHEHCDADYVVVMDGDGEDPPPEAVRLVNAARENDEVAVFAQRMRRTEGLVFRLGYLAFRILHRVLVGTRVEIGNLSVLPRAALARVVGVSEIWNHYAAGVAKARIPMRQLPAQRTLRLRGSSKMNFVSLVIHGFSAMSVWGEVIGVRVLVAMGAALLVACSTLLALFAVQVDFGGQTPWWFLSVAGSLGVLILIFILVLLSLSMLFTFVILHARSTVSFHPLRDYRLFVLAAVPLLGPSVPDAGTRTDEVNASTDAAHSLVK